MDSNASGFSATWLGGPAPVPPRPTKFVGVCSHPHWQPPIFDKGDKVVVEANSNWEHSGKGTVTDIHMYTGWGNTHGCDVEFEDGNKGSWVNQDLLRFAKKHVWEAPVGAPRGDYTFQACQDCGLKWVFSERLGEPFPIDDCPGRKDHRKALEQEDRYPWGLYVMDLQPGCFMSGRLVFVLGSKLVEVNRGPDWRPWKVREYAYWDIEGERIDHVRNVEIDKMSFKPWRVEGYKAELDARRALPKVAKRLRRDADRLHEEADFIDQQLQEFERMIDNSVARA